MADAREGKVLQGRYRIMSMLAEGGMGVVYKAERVGIGRPVVVKFLHAILSDKPGIVDRFEREARATARLNHPHCVSLVDFGIDDGSPYLVMEFVEGQTLADLLDHGAVKGERAVSIARQILAGLEHAHERGILHRDLKPANVMIIETEGYSSDFVKILDFGLAKLAWPGEDKRDVTVEGIAIGTPGYMSPEQAAGVPSDRRSDIYCTGALLYHLVTGSKAFEGDDVRSVLRRHREETPASPRAIKGAAGLSKQLEDAIERAMQREPGKRYQTARDMMAALDATPEWKRRGDGTATSVTSGSRPPTPTALDRTRAEGPRGRRAGRRMAAVWVVLGLLVGSTGALAAVLYSPLGRLVSPPRRVEVVTHEPAPAPSETASAKPSAQKPADDHTVTPEPSGAATANGTPSSANGTPANSEAAAKSPASAAPGAAELGTAGKEGTVAAKDGTAATKDGPPTATAARLSTAPARPSEAPSNAAAEEDEDTDPAPGNGDDGSNESDRTPPPEPAAAPRREASQVRSVAEARALMRKGDYDGALAGLYRLRRGKPTPSASRSSEIATLIGHLYFERKWWTDALREYRFAIALDPRARRDESLLGNSVRALSDRGTYLRARRLILEYVGRSAVPALKRASRTGTTPALRRRSQKVLATLESKSYRTRR